MRRTPALVSAAPRTPIAPAGARLGHPVQLPLQAQGSVQMGLENLQPQQMPFRI